MVDLGTKSLLNFSLEKGGDRNGSNESHFRPYSIFSCGGLFYDSNFTIISDHIYNLYSTPLLTQFNKTSESERKREQLQLQKSSIYEICKSRGWKSSVIVDSITRICGLRQHQLSQKCCKVIKLSQTTLDAVLGPSPKLSPQPTSATTTREINVARPHKHLSSIFKKKAIVKVTSNYLEHQHKIDTLSKENLVVREKEFRRAISKKGLHPDTGVGNILLEELVTDHLKKEVNYYNNHGLKSFKLSLHMDPPDSRVQVV